MKISFICIMGFLCFGHVFAEGEVRLNPKTELAKRPDIEVISSNDKIVQIKVSNNTGVDLTYSGYDRDRPWLHRIKFVDGKWGNGGSDWCATGVSKYTLKSGTSVVFKLASLKDIRYYTSFFDELNKKRSFIKLYENKSG